MKKLIPLAFVCLIAYACAPTTRIDKTPIKNPLEGPFITHSSKTPEQVWSKLIDLIAIEKWPIGHINKDNGIYISGTINKPTYTYTQDQNAYLLLPSLKYQETNPSGSTVKRSRTLQPDSLSMHFNVRIRPDEKGGTYINVNVHEVNVKGAFYNKRVIKLTVPPDTINVKTIVGTKPDSWAGSTSTGNLEKYISDYIK